MGRAEYNKTLQVYSLFSKLYSLTRGCYQWDNRIKNYVPAKNFTQQFEVVIKVAEDLKRHRAVEFLMEQIRALEVPKREGNGSK